MTYKTLVNRLVKMLNAEGPNVVLRRVQQDRSLLTAWVGKGGAERRQSTRRRTARADRRK